ncbi:unnamed protein product [Rotaria sp. Silwood1]|nr:unnamed protein product [Rotaria sp. Silwood1]CAF3461815.1 unnamed protein product [Rotaria sp. Silwood1]CAF3476260.1 unnamed protein product [Rotaria sp. Silwood1]CAF3488566.1 unnamed protein product [Rotaria sp. Silwood1]CAF3503371.1 unnamed protein product [Rotaria sp. Silwood1]
MMPELFNPNNKAFTMNALRNDLWLLKLLYVLVNQEPPMNSKEHFVQFFSLYYKENPKNEQLLKEFSDSYDSSKAVWWYTRDTFIYKILNQAMRERNIQVLCKYHFFIRDLYKQIEAGHRLFNERNSSIRVYRGQIMNTREIERIKEANKYDLRLSTHCLLSTSLERDPARVFILGFNSEDDLRGVLFEIECNPIVKSRPFAEISHESQFQDEKEVLFMPGAAFAVSAIEFDKTDQLHIIKLRLCNDEDIQKGFHKKNIFKGDRDIVQELLDAMGTTTIVRECSDLDHLYGHMIKLFPMDELLELSYLQAMGSKHFTNKNFETSINFFKRSLSLQENSFSADKRKIAELLCSIGESYYKLKIYDEAISFYHQAIELNSLSLSKSLMAHLYMGYSHLTRDNRNYSDDISLANYYLQTALHIDLENEILGDEMIMNLYQALADIHEYQDELNLAIGYYNEALEICERNEWTNDSNEIKAKIEAINQKSVDVALVEEDKSNL